MINEKRVQRIRKIIYAFIVLIIIAPVILMAIIGFKLIWTLDALQSTLSGTSQSQSAQVTPPGNNDNEYVIPSSDKSEASKSDVAESSTSPDEKPPKDLDESSQLGQDNVVDVDSGRYQINTYLPASYPNLYFETIPVVDTPVDTSTLYLTFDNTPALQGGEILSVLQKHDVRATFFVWWNDTMGDKNYEYYKTIVDSGHQIGIHCGGSATRLSTMYAGVDSFLGEFDRVFTAVETKTGASPRIYRLPGGSINRQNSQRQQVLSDIKSELDARGFLQYDWNASAQDAVSPALSKEQVLRNLERSLGESEQIVILMHDGTGSSSTAQALDEFIAQQKAAGMNFDVLSEHEKPVSFLDQ